MRQLSVPTHTEALPGPPRLTVVRRSGGGILPDALVINQEPVAAEPSTAGPPLSRRRRPALRRRFRAQRQPAAVRSPRRDQPVAGPAAAPARATAAQTRLAPVVRRGSLPGHLWHHRPSRKPWRHHRRTRRLQTAARL
jgi:hypothetical protein